MSSKSQSQGSSGQDTATQMLTSTAGNASHISKYKGYGGDSDWHFIKDDSGQVQFRLLKAGATDKRWSVLNVTEHSFTPMSTGVEREIEEGLARAILTATRSIIAQQSSIEERVGRLQSGKGGSTAKRQKTAKGLQREMIEFERSRTSVASAINSAKQVLLDRMERWKQVELPKLKAEYNSGPRDMEALVALRSKEMDWARLSARLHLTWQVTACNWSAATTGISAVGKLEVPKGPKFYAELEGRYTLLRDSFLAWKDIYNPTEVEAFNLKMSSDYWKPSIEFDVIFEHAKSVTMSAVAVRSDLGRASSVSLLDSESYPWYETPRQGAVVRRGDRFLKDLGLGELRLNRDDNRGEGVPRTDAATKTVQMLQEMHERMKLAEAIEHTTATTQTTAEQLVAADSVCDPQDLVDNIDTLNALKLTQQAFKGWVHNTGHDMVFEIESQTTANLDKLSESATELEGSGIKAVQELGQLARRWRDQSRIDGTHRLNLVKEDLLDLLSKCTDDSEEKAGYLDMAQSISQERTAKSKGAPAGKLRRACAKVDLSEPPTTLDDLLEFIDTRKAEIQKRQGRQSEEGINSATDIANQEHGGPEIVVIAPPDEDHRRSVGLEADTADWSDSATLSPLDSPILARTDSRLPTLFDARPSFADASKAASRDSSASRAPSPWKWDHDYFVENHARSPVEAEDITWIVG